jgi:SAM-dependent methyltransferase
MATWYQHWFASPYYHMLYSEGTTAEARALLQQLLQHLKPAAGSRMLHVGCGHGEHSRVLAEAGYEVTGTDISHENVAYAKQSENDTLHFYQHDPRLPFWVNYFDYAFNLFTSFGYFTTQREHEAAVRSVSQSLKPGGYLVFDYLNVHYAEAYLKHNEIKTIGTSTFEIHRWHDASHFYKRIRITDPNLEQPLEVTEKIAKLGLDDFTEMLAFQKMQVTDVFGDYQLHPYDLHKTPRLILFVRKDRH